MCIASLPTGFQNRLKYPHMQHLIDVIIENREHADAETSKTLALLEKYLPAGDKEAWAALQALPYGRLWILTYFDRALPLPHQWGEEDRRLVRLAALQSPVIFPHIDGKSGAGKVLSEMFGKVLAKEGPGEDFTSAFQKEILAAGADPSRLAAFVADSAVPLVREGMNSAGRFLSSEPPAAVAPLVPVLRNSQHFYDFVQVWSVRRTAHFGEVCKALVESGQANSMFLAGWMELLKQNPKKYEELCSAAFQAWQNPYERRDLVARLHELFPEKYEEIAWEAALAHLQAGPIAQSGALDLMLQVRGVAAVPTLCELVDRWTLKEARNESGVVEIMERASEALGTASRPILEAALKTRSPRLQRNVVEVLVKFKDPADDEQIALLIDELLVCSDAWYIESTIPIAASRDLVRVTPRLLELVAHTKKSVRDEAVQALAKVGDAATPKAAELLSAKEPKTRIAAATLLGRAASPAAVAALRRALETEKATAVVEALRAALTAAGEAPPVAVPVAKPTAQPAASRKSVEAAIRKAAVKSKSPAKWLKPEKLPPLYFRDGTVLDADAVRYLLYRQSRSKEIEADEQARPLYGLIDPARSGDFALAVLEAFLKSDVNAADRWALALAGLLGDERVVPALARHAQTWAEELRELLAKFAVQALAMQASDAALLSVDAIAVRLSSKSKSKLRNTGLAAQEAFARAAAARGLTLAELGDCVVPWLGFTPGQPRLIEWRGAKLEVTVGLDFKPAYRDAVKRKRVAALPGGAPAAIKTEMKGLAATLKEAARAQLLRLENLLVLQHRWPAARWAELFPEHPLLIPFAVGLVWGLYDSEGKLTATFRALEDHTLTTSADEAFPKPTSGLVGIVHPLELAPKVRQKWLEHFADYNLVSPFPQLDRPVAEPTPKQLKCKFLEDFKGIELHALTFRGRAEKRGWNRGSVVDGGEVSSYFRCFPAAGVDAIVFIGGMYMGGMMDSVVTLDACFFVRHRSVQIGDYVYDEPENENDERLIPAGEVPPIIFSEAFADLRHIAAQGPARQDA
jgi:hypothetical protein